MDYERGPAPQLQYPSGGRQSGETACHSHDPQSSTCTTDIGTFRSQNLFHELAKLENNSPEFRRTVDEIVRVYIPLADNIARRFAHRGEPRDDLVQVARLGLLNAVHRFDIGFGIDFAAFAVPTIMGGLRRHFRDNSWSVKVPRRLKELNVQLDIATSDLYQRLGRAPTTSDMAQELGADRDEVIAALIARNCSRTLPIDGGTDDESGPHAPINSLGHIDDALERIEYWESIRPVLKTLPERERAILQLRFFESRTQTEIAERLGISQMHVSRLLRKSLSCLKDQLLDS